MCIKGRGIIQLSFGKWKRRLTSRELLRLQGFPEAFKIVVSYQAMRKLTGNSVAVPVIKAVADKMIEAIKKRQPIINKEHKQALIVSLLNQIGWKAKIQSIITEGDLKRWYEKALRGSYGLEIGGQVLLTLKEQIIAEFPASDNKDFIAFYESRNYNLLTDDLWI